MMGEVKIPGGFWAYFEEPDALVGALTPNMTSLMQSRGMNDKLVLRSRIRMSDNDVDSAEKFVSYLQNETPEEAVFATLVEWMNRANLGHLVKKTAPVSTAMTPGRKTFLAIARQIQRDAGTLNDSVKQNTPANTSSQRKAGPERPVTIIATKPDGGDGRFWDFFSDPEALVNALAFRMSALMRSRGMHDGLPFSSRISLASDSVESSSKFVSYLQNGSPNDRVFLSLVQWMKSDDGNLGHLLRTDSPRAGKLPKGTLFVEPEICEGRETVIRTIVDVVCGIGSVPAVFLRGIGGIGKSTVALKALCHPRVVACFKEFRFFVRCDKIATIDELQTRILTDLGLFLAPEQTSLDAILTFLRISKTVVVLDNFEDVLHDVESYRLKDVLSLIAKDCSLVLTFRGRLDVPLARASKSVDVDVLDPADAKTAFLAFAGRTDWDRTNEDALSSLLKQLDGYPLVISIVARLAISRSIVQLAAEYRDRLGLDKLGHGVSRDDSLCVSIELSLTSGIVSDTAGAELLCFLVSQLPDGAHRDLIVRVFLETLDGNFFEIQATEASAALVQAGLATVNPSTTLLRMITPVRDYFASRVALVGNKSDTLTRIVTEYCFGLAGQSNSIHGHPGQTTNEELIATIGNQFQNIDTVVTAACQKPDTIVAAAVAAKALGDFACLNMPVVPKALLASVRATREAGFLPALGGGLRSLGKLAIREGRLTEAFGYLDEALAVSRDTGGFSEEANCLKYLGDLAMHDDRLRDASKHLTEALAIFQRVKDPLGEAKCLESIGQLAMHEDKLEEAAPHMAEALALFRRIEERLGEANCLKSLGQLALRQNRHREASEHLTQALATFRQIKDRLGEANCLVSLGSLATATQKFPEALGYLAGAVNIFQQIQDQIGLANSYRTMGDVAVIQGRDEDAARLFSQGLVLSDKIQYRSCQEYCRTRLQQLAPPQQQTAEERSTATALLNKRVRDREQSSLLFNSSLEYALPMPRGSPAVPSVAFLGPTISGVEHVRRASHSVVQGESADPPIAGVEPAQRPRLLGCRCILS